jgi:hypothetical protein
MGMADKTIGEMESAYRGQRIAQATRELKFHPSASHISPDYRDGWNHAIEQVALLWERYGLGETPGTNNLNLNPAAPQEGGGVRDTDGRKP